MRPKDKDIEPVDINVGRRIREARYSRGMSQTALAKALGLTFQAVQKYEKGENRVSASMLVKVAEALQKSVSWFFGEEEQSPVPTTTVEGKTRRQLFRLQCRLTQIAETDPALLDKVGVIIRTMTTESAPKLQRHSAWRPNLSHRR